jgi:hypothetical protein
MSSPPNTETGSPLRDTLRWVRAHEKNAERTWTYREVGVEAMVVLEQIVMSGDLRQDMRDVQTRLEYCLQMARSVRERDDTLDGVVNSLAQLMRCINREDDLATGAVQEAVETVLLDVQFCISHHV